jgi:hypothetical protein
MGVLAIEEQEEGDEAEVEMTDFAFWRGGGVLLVAALERAEMKKSRRSYVAARMSMPITMVFRFVVGIAGGGR